MSDGYLEYRQIIANKKLVGPILTTDASNLLFMMRRPDEKPVGSGIFLDNIDPSQRQNYSCHCCSKFFETYGVLVDANGKSILWDENEAPEDFKKAVKAMRLKVESAKVNGIFLSEDKVWGTPKSGLSYSHFAVDGIVTKDAGPRMAEYRQDFGLIKTSLLDFSKHVDDALALVNSGALFRGEKIKGQAEWFSALRGKSDRELWVAVATAPTGFTHIRSSVFGSLLQDLKDGVSDAVERFGAKMDPATYRRPTAAPSTAAILEAERAVTELGIAPAFERRYASAREIQVIAWRPPTDGWGVVEQPPTPKGGVFDHLKPSATAKAEVAIPPKVMTWEKFNRDVLPGAMKISYRVPLVGPFCGLTAPANSDAPPILQWSSGISWAFSNPPARADEFSLIAGTLVEVEYICPLPSRWQNDIGDQGIFIALKGAKDMRKLPGGGFFMEHLRSDLVKYRRTIEAHVNKLVVADGEAFGIGYLPGAFTELSAPAGITGPQSVDAVNVYLLIDSSGSMASYLGSARNALRAMINAIRAMPGKVNVTVIKFNAHFRTIADRQPVAALDGVENQMTADGGTRLNDVIINTIDLGMQRKEVTFLAIVTDGDDQGSSATHSTTARAVKQAQDTGKWTIVLAGAGSNPRGYGRDIGIPDGNITEFGATNAGFEEMGERMARGTTSLASSYSAGTRASTTFFGAATKEVGKDHPVFQVIMKSGAKMNYSIDRWE